MKVLNVGVWVRYLGLCPENRIFLTPSLIICFSSMTVFAWLCFTEKHLLLFNQIPGYSTGSITDNEKVIAAIIQQRQW